MKLSSGRMPTRRLRIGHKKKVAGGNFSPRPTRPEKKPRLRLSEGGGIGVGGKLSDGKDDCARAGG